MSRHAHRAHAKPAPDLRKIAGFRKNDEQFDVTKIHFIYFRYTVMHFLPV